MRRVIASLNKAAKLLEDSQLTDEDKLNIQKYPLLPGNEFEVHLGSGRIDRGIILGIPVGTDAHSMMLPVQFVTGEKSNYSLYGMGILHTGQFASPNSTLIRIAKAEGQ